MSNMMSTPEGDHLCYSSNPKILNGILKNQSEKIFFSDFVVKINRKNKEQNRTMVITNEAVYNIKKQKAKRRILVMNLLSITTSKSSEEFVMHVPEEYDYRYKSAKKEEIIAAIKKANPKVNVIATDESELNEVALTKPQASQQTREQILRRTQALVAQDKSSDEDDRKEVDNQTGGSGGITTHEMMQGQQAVNIADFELLKVLGRGAFGKVMQVKKKDDGKVYAMKILKKQAILSRNQVEHTKAERKILQTLQHPFLMTLRYAFQSNDKLYLVLDYFQGGELFFHLKSKRRFCEETARLYVAEIAMAFGHLHGSGVIYRDLKPENILLDDGGHVCLTDFGLAKEVSAGEKTETFCGTPEYLAPEIIQGLGHDKAVDWWSLGILLYELTVGIPPFYSQNVNEMYHKIQHGVLRFPPFLSKECKDLIVELLCRDPVKRLGSGEDFQDLKVHPFFAPLDWEKVFNKEIDAPFKPKVTGIEDTSNFDEEFLREPVVDSVVPQSTTFGGQGDKDAFKDFTYKGKGGLG